MSVVPDIEISGRDVRRGEFSPVQFATLGAVFAVLGTLAIWPTILALWTMWMTDLMKSVGMIIPLASMILILRVWRSLDWKANGSWWGFVLLMFAVTIAWAQQQAVFLLVVSPRWPTPLHHTR